MMSTRRSFFIFGAVVAVVALLAPATVVAQTPEQVTIDEVGDPPSFHELKVGWGRTGAADPDMYRVYYQEEPTGDVSASNADGYVDVDGDERQVTLTGLDHSTTYEAAVAPIEDGTVGALVNSATSGDLSEMATTGTAPDPSTPRNVEAMGGDMTFTLSWGASFAGHSSLTVEEYRVQKREVAGNLIGDWIPDESNDDNDKMGGLKVEGDMTMVTFEDLDNGTTYEGRVRAMNSAGQWSDWSTRDGDMPDDDATAMVGDDGGDDMEDMEETPALPLVGLLALFVGLLGAARARLRR